MPNVDRAMPSEKQVVKTLNNFRYSLYDFSLGVLFNAFVALCYFNIMLVVIAYRQSYSLSLLLLAHLSFDAIDSIVSSHILRILLYLFLSFTFYVYLCVCCRYIHIYMHTYTGLLRVYFTKLANKNNKQKLRQPLCMYLNNINCLVDWLSVVRCGLSTMVDVLFSERCELVNGALDGNSGDGSGNECFRCHFKGFAFAWYRNLLHYRQVPDGYGIGFVSLSNEIP